MTEERKTDDSLLIDYLAGKLSEEENRQVKEWVGSSGENEKLLEQLYYIHFVCERMSVDNKVNVEESLSEFWNKTKKQERRKKLNKISIFCRQAAAILFIPLFVLSVYNYMNDKMDIQYIEAHSNPGMVAKVELPDGSKVWLNSKSRIKFPQKFNSDIRNVELQGEAFFEVEKDAKKPFIVNIDNNYSVKVLGTSFNVIALEDEDEIETVLVDGSVELCIKMNEKDSTFLLTPDDKSVFNKKTNTVNIEKINAENQMAWKDGKLVFRSTPMRQVLKTLERNFNVKFNVDDEKVYESVLTARFDRQQLQQILDFLSIASNINFKTESPINKNMEGNTVIKVNMKKKQH